MSKRGESVSDGKSKALEMTLANLTKRFGDGAVMRLGEATHLQEGFRRDDEGAGIA